MLSDQLRKFVRYPEGQWAKHNHVTNDVIIKNWVKFVLLRLDS